MPCLKMANVMVALVRGACQLIAAVSGLLLVFGLTYAMEGMTSRLPMGAAGELATVTAFMFPWTLLFCSGFHDLSKVLGREWIFWLGNLGVLAFLYYFNRYTADATLTKTAMPILACAVATIPHVLRRLSFFYSVLCVLFALCGIAILYFDIKTFVTPGHSFATPAIAALMGIFPLASITAGALSIILLFRRAQSTGA